MAQDYRRLFPGATVGAWPFGGHQVASMYEPLPDLPDGDNPDVPAGYTYLLQFLSHDLALTLGIPPWGLVDISLLINGRTPRLDLDSVYGGGPDAAPELYEAPGAPKFAVGRTAAGDDDLPRALDATATIADGRNDQHVILGQLHLAFLKFHNEVVQRLGSTMPGVFAEAQRLVRWHFQWIVLHDLMPRIVDPALLAAILPAGASVPTLDVFDVTHGPFVPIEFSGAIFRFGHSMPRDRYHLNDRLNEIRARTDGGNIVMFAPGNGVRDTDDLRGHKHLPAEWAVQWNRFVPTTAPVTPQPSRRINTMLAPSLQRMPAFEPSGSNLALRTLELGNRLGLPSGQSVAEALSVDTIAPGEHWPLWYYVLKEAELAPGAGTRLGAAGARIVAEVVIGLLCADPDSFIARDPAWTPDLARVGQPRVFELLDLVRMAGMRVDSLIA